MPTIGSNSKPAYVYDAGTDTWIPIGPGEHTHEYIGKNVITTTGDIIYASAANTPARLGIGSTDQVLKVSGGIPAWGAAPPAAFVGVAAYLATTTAIANATETNISWTEYLDSDGFHSDSTNPTRFTVPSGKAGKYAITRFFHFQPNGSGQRYSNLKKNGTNAQSEVPIITVASSGTNGASKTDLIDLAVGDYIEVSVVQSSGGNLNLYGNNDSYKATAFTMVYLGA